MINNFSKYLVILNIVTTFAPNYEYKKQNIQYYSLRQPVGFRFVCCIYPIHQPGSVLYGSRPFRVYLRNSIFQYPSIKALWSYAVCRRLVDAAFLPSRCRLCRAGGYLGADFLGGNQSIPVKAQCLRADALACSLPAHLSSRSWLLDLYFSCQRLLVFTVGRLSRHAVAPVGGTLHPATMAPRLVSDRRLPLSGARVVCSALRAVLSGCRKAHLARVLSDCPAALHGRHLAYATLSQPEGRRCRHGGSAPLHNPER